MGKRINKILWHGDEIDADGKAIPPQASSEQGATDGLNPGEVYISDADQDPCIFIRTNTGRVVRVGGADLTELENYFLRKDKSDTAYGHILFKEGLTSEKISRFDAGVRFGEFIKGILYGTGGQVDALGNAEFESIVSRSSIITKELITNRQTAMEGSFLFTESGVVERIVEVPPSTEGGNTTYELTLQKRWENDFTAFKEQDVVLGSVNTLMEDGAYYDIWFRVLSVNTVSNMITVVSYPDDEVPSGKNYAPVELARLIRWGNAVDEARQSCWYLSSYEHLFVMLDHVTKPIINRTNYSLALGRLPESLSWIFKDFPDADGGDSWLYAKGVAADQLLRVDYQGNVVPEVRDRGLWSAETAVSDPYVHTSSVVDDVWHYGCRWRCLKDGTTDEPSYSSTDWAFVSGNPEFTVSITSTNDWSFSMREITATDETGAWAAFTVLGVTGTLYNRDVTEHLYNVQWTRDTGDVTSDNAWALSHASAGTSLPLRYDDLGESAYRIGHVKFRVTAEIKDGETGTEATAYEEVLF